MKISIGSIFFDSPRNSVWLDLQQRFIQETTNCDYEYAVYLNHIESDELFRSVELIGHNPNPPAARKGVSISHSHANAISAVVDYFQTREADYFLILDSDCFPFVLGWPQKLVSKMGLCSFAAPVRYENLDVFPHPSAFFMSNEFLGRGPDFSVTSTTNLLGDVFDDVAAGISLKDIYPLVRTNYLNLHPVLFGIYHYFYHHGCGSRPVTMRTLAAKYYDQYSDNQKVIELENRTFKRLRHNPKSIIHLLTRGKTWL